MTGTYLLRYQEAILVVDEADLTCGHKNVVLTQLNVWRNRDVARRSHIRGDRATAGRSMTDFHCDVFINHLHSSNILILTCNILLSPKNNRQSFTSTYAHGCLAVICFQPNAFPASRNDDLLTGLPPFHSPLDLK